MTIPYREFFQYIGYNKDLPCKLGLKGRQADGITAKQQLAIRNMGVGTTGIAYKGQASIVLNLLISRANAQLATPWQMHCLSSLGIERVNEYTYQQAFQLLECSKPTRNGAELPWKI